MSESQEGTLMICPNSSCNRMCYHNQVHDDNGDCNNDQSECPTCIPLEKEDFGVFIDI